MLQKLLLSFSILFLCISINAQTTYEFDGPSQEESGVMNFIIGFNSFTKNYSKVHFCFEDSIQNIYLYDSIDFKRKDYATRVGFSNQVNLKNNFLINGSISCTFPILKRFRQNQYSIGIGYQFQLKDYFFIRPFIEYEINRFYHPFNNFQSYIGQTIYVNGRNMGNFVDIRYIQTSHGIAPKINFAFRPPSKKETNRLEFSMDLGYHFSFSEKSKLQFRRSNSTAGGIIADLIVVAFRNLSSKKAPIGQYLKSDNQPITKNIITPEKMYFSIKIGYTF